MIIMDIWGNDSVVGEQTKCSRCQIAEDNLKNLGNHELCEACFTEAARYIQEITPQLEIIPNVD